MKTRYKILLAAVTVAPLLVAVVAYWDLQAAPACEGPQARFDPGSPVVSNGWGLDLTNARALRADSAALTVADLPELVLQWAFRFPLWTNKARSQPAVTADTIYVGSQRGWVYALNRHAGCVRWKSRIGAEVRTALTLGEARPQGERLLFFGDFFGRAYALDAATGERVWRTEVDSHRAATITGSPVLHEGRLYVPVSSFEVALPAFPFYGCCTFRGSVVALDAATGERIWKTHTTEAPQVQGRNALWVRRWGPSGAPIWSPPTIDTARNRLYVGTGENYSQPTNHLSDAILALDLTSGEIVWSRQLTPRDAWNFACAMPGKINCPENPGKDLDFGAPPILVPGRDGRDMLVAGQKSGVVYGLDPDDEGKILWTQRLGRGGALGGVHWSMAARDGVVYVPISDYLTPIPGLDAPEPEDPTMPKMPGLHAVDVATGHVLWSTPAVAACSDPDACYPGLSAAVTVLRDMVIAATLDGRVQAYDVSSGRLLWETDTARSFAAIDGRTAMGGAIDAGGAIVAGRQLIVNSGYGLFSEAPGNALLVYGPAGSPPARGMP